MASKIKTTDMSMNPDAMPKSTTSTDNSGKTVKVKVRKVLAKNRISHRKGHGKVSTIHLHTLNGVAIKLAAKQAHQMVSAGSASYISKTVYRELIAKKKS